MSIQKTGQCTRKKSARKPSTERQTWLSAGQEMGDTSSPGQSILRTTFIGIRWPRPAVGLTALAIAISSGLAIAPVYSQLRIDSEVVAPQDPTPQTPLIDDGEGWDMEEEFEEEDGVTPLLRGPLHEAYAERFSDDIEDPVIIDKAPPELIDEQPPEVAPEGENYVWIPGYWGWDLAEEDFVWVSGVWRKMPPKHQWVPGYWAELDGGWQWVSGFWTTTAEENIAYLPAPPETLDVGPSSPAPGDNYFWIPGCWNFTGGSYSWRAGYWGAAQNDWVWMPNRYVWTPSGYIYRRGYWDYRLPNRGMVFTPVHFRPGYHGVYRPAYTVQVNPLLLANLFIAPGFNQYYYGNYFGYHGHRKVYSWSSYYRHGHDPFLSYYAHQHRHEKWLRDLNRLGHHISMTPHLQSQIRVADQFRHRHEMHRGPNSIDTLLRVSNAKRLATSTRPSFRPNVPLTMNRDVHTKFPRDKVVDPIREFERKRRDLEKAVTDVDRDRGRRPTRDGDRGQLIAPVGPTGQPRDSIEIKQLKLGTRDEFRGRPAIPKDLQVDRKTERITAPGTREIRPQTVDRDKLRENRTRELDRILGTKPDEKLTPEQLRDVRRDLLGNPGNRRPGSSTSGPRPDRPEGSNRLDNSDRPGRSDRSELTRPGTRPDGRPDLAPGERPDSPRLQGRGPSRAPSSAIDALRRALPPQSDLRDAGRPGRDGSNREDRPRIDSPRTETPRIESSPSNSPRASNPRPEVPRVQTPRVEKPRIETPRREVPRREEPRAETPRRDSPRIETPRVETPRIQSPAVERPRVERPRVERPRIETPRRESPRIERPNFERGRVERGGGSRSAERSGADARPRREAIQDRVRDRSR